MVSRDSIHHNTGRNRDSAQIMTERDRRIPEKEFHCVLHFNLTVIALTAFFILFYNWIAYLLKCSHHYQDEGSSLGEVQYY